MKNLIFELAKIDRKAALIYKREIKLRLKRGELKFSGDVENPPVNDIVDFVDCFNWNRTRQNRKFWENVMDNVNSYFYFRCA